MIYEPKTTIGVAALTCWRNVGTERTPLQEAERVLRSVRVAKPDVILKSGDWYAEGPAGVAIDLAPVMAAALKAIRGAASMNACLQVARDGSHLLPGMVASDIDWAFTAVLDHIIEGKP